MLLNPILILMTEFDQSGVVYNPDSGETFALNRTAVFIYRQIQKGFDRSRILDELKSACGTSLPADDILVRELDSFFDAMTVRGWLHK